jgi:hypothetical protein
MILPARRVLAVLADRVIAPSGRVGLRPADVGVVAGVERLLAKGPGIFRWGIGVLLIAFNYSPLFFGFGLSRFVRLPPERQDAYLDAALSSRWYERRMATRSLVILIQLAFYGDPRVAAAVKGDPAPTEPC